MSSVKQFLRDVLLVSILPAIILSGAVVGMSAETIFGTYGPLSAVEILLWAGYMVFATFGGVSLMLRLQGKPVIVFWKTLFR